MDSLDIIEESIVREFGEDSQLVLDLYRAYRAKGARGIREVLRSMLSKYGIKL